jgi:hypothetical protein
LHKGHGKDKLKILHFEFAMKNYLLSQNAADFLKGQMTGQSARNTPPGDAANGTRVSGAFQPFEIISDWTKADGENAYSCRGAMIAFDGRDFIKEQDGFQFPLYSPLDLNEKPSYAPGDKCFAVLRGGRWEIVGGMGKTLEFDGISVRTATTTLVSGGKAGTQADMISAPLLAEGCAVPAGTRLLCLKIGNTSYVLAPESYAEYIALPTPNMPDIVETGLSWPSVESWPDAVVNQTFQRLSTQNNGSTSASGTAPFIQAWPNAGARGLYLVTAQYSKGTYVNGPPIAWYMLFGITPDQILTPSITPGTVSGGQQTLFIEKAAFTTGMAGGIGTIQYRTTATGTWQNYNAVNGITLAVGNRTIYTQYALTIPNLSWLSIPAYIVTTPAYRTGPTWQFTIEQ